MTILLFWLAANSMAAGLITGWWRKRVFFNEERRKAMQIFGRIILALAGIGSGWAGAGYFRGSDTLVVEGDQQVATVAVRSMTDAHLYVDNLSGSIYNQVPFAKHQTPVGEIIGWRLFLDRTDKKSMALLKSLDSEEKLRIVYRVDTIGKEKQMRLLAVKQYRKSDVMEWKDAATYAPQTDALTPTNSEAKKDRPVIPNSRI